jgi:hypothetical protein
VERSEGAVEDSFIVDWKAEDNRGRIAEGHEPRLRLHGFTPCEEVALAAGDPPANKAGNPEKLRYLLQSRKNHEATAFLNVLEPYDQETFIESVEELEVHGCGDPAAAQAVRVEMKDGTVDLLVACERPMRVAVEGGLVLYGRLGLVRLRDGEPVLMRLVGGEVLRYGKHRLTAPVGEYAGEVVSVDITDPADNRVELSPSLPQDKGIEGAVIHFRNGQPIDASYDVVSVTDNGISTGDRTLILGFQEEYDFDSGYAYLVNPGDQYYVPIVTTWDAE